MRIINIHAAKTQLSQLIADVLAGEEVVIAKAGTPVVKLVPLTATDEPRRLGALAGMVTEAPDCWAPDAELEALFYGDTHAPPPVRRVAVSPPKKPRKRK